MSEKVRVRYAPSPTGYLHIGNARTALFNYLFARHHDGKFVIRTEDTDQKRHVEGGEESQFENLRWLGIDWDEASDLGGEYGPYRQSERLHIYTPLVEKLLAEDKAYKCYCTAEELETEREKQMAEGKMPQYSGKCAHLTDEERAEKESEGITPVVRIRTDQKQVYTFNDLVKGEISFEGKSVGSDWVILKRDGFPTYNFAVVVDDHYMEISHVLRGDDHISNTPKQLLVYEALGWEAPKFGHMTLIINAETGKKLSKRDTDVLQFIEDYRELGYLPEALFNFIALLGWSPVGEEEIFSQEELIEIFDHERLGTSPAAFDAAKLDWIANEYIKALDLDELVELVIAKLKEDDYISGELSDEEYEHYKKLTSLYQEQMSYTKALPEVAGLFFDQEINWSEEALNILSGETVPAVLKAFKSELSTLETFDASEISKAIKEVQKETGVKGRDLYMPIRVATTGQQHGPQLGDSIELLGKEKVLDHLEEALNQIND
ncbi:MAG: glutamate--tRNA ligase [Atopostipes suicloacalis]|nr:glutamate--tRNA ligase [Atopostipes suicloacalis]MDN6730607.1 glutamate--tRNA ligase [Atopostipes suicloacalis]